MADALQRLREELDLARFIHNFPRIAALKAAIAALKAADDAKNQLNGHKLPEP